MFRALPASAAALFLAGCGGSGSSTAGDSAGSQPPPTAIEPPVVTITSPFAGSRFDEGEAVHFAGSANDPQDGQLDGESLTWTAAALGQFGVGSTASTGSLSIGLHTIHLTATNSAGASTTASVSIQVAGPMQETAARFGETNPYAGIMSRTPVKLDDELIVIGPSAAQDEFVVGIIDDPIVRYVGPSGEHGLAPRITQRRERAVPRAAAAGRVLGTNLHQVAIASERTGASGNGQFLLELIGIDSAGQYTVAEYAFQPPLPDGAIEVAVADLDAFDEISGSRMMEPPLQQNSQYHDEVVLVYQEPVGAAVRGRIHVLSFEDVEFPHNRTGPTPGPVSNTSHLTSEPMWPASRIVVQHGDAFYGALQGPHLVVAYLDTQRRIVIDVFKLERERDDPSNGTAVDDARSLVHVEHVVFSDPLSEAAAVAGGWDIVVGRGSQLGIRQLTEFDFVLVVWQQDGQFHQHVWKLEDLSGFRNPTSIASTSGEFARLPDGAGGEMVLSILADSRVDIALGRIIDPDPNVFDLQSCEAVGLFVLADTNRGAAVQSMTAFIEDPFLGAHRLGPPYPGPVWPHLATIWGRADTDQPAKVSLAAGGFVSERNGLIDERGNPAGVGTRFASDCPNVNPRPYLGPMPSFYVAEPETSQLHAVTLNLGTVSGGGSVVSSPLDGSIDMRPILLAADADGNAAYYSAMRCIGDGPGDCRRLFLGDAELQYSIENIETSNVVLQQPPKHIDYLPALGGIVNVSMRDGYFAEFVQTDELSGNISRQTRTDWTIGERLGVGLGPPKLPGMEFKSTLDLSLDIEHQTVAEQFDASQVSVSLTQAVGAVHDDVVWSKIQTIDFWRFPIQGGKPERQAHVDSGMADDAYMEIAVPAEPMSMIGPGVLNENYQPLHQVGNILTYPTFSGSVDDLGDLFNYLGHYVPTDEAGTRRCRPLSDGDPFGCVIRTVTGALQRVTEVLAGDDFVAGEFESLTSAIDVAEVLQVGGISYSAELQFDTSVRRGQTVSNSDRIKAEANAKVPLKVAVKGVPLQFGELEAQIRAAASFENARISDNTLGSRTKIGLHIPADIPTERSYRIRPSFGFSPGGSLHVSYQVSTEGETEQFWLQHYSEPDPALNLPHRIVRTSDGFKLGTDLSRNRMKGVFFRDGSDVDPLWPANHIGPMLVTAPHSGDPVQIEAKVYNLSLATAVSNLDVQFHAQWLEHGQPVGEPVLIGESRIDYLPYRGEFADLPTGHITSTYVLWDTTGFGPLPGNALRTYMVSVTLDPHDRIPNETHELHDRFDDPLLSPSGEPLDELEKGQNNFGWTTFRIAPALVDEAAMQVAAYDTSASKRSAGEAADGDAVRLRIVSLDATEVTPVIEGRASQAVELRIILESDSLERDFGLLQAFEGDPEAGGRVILSRTVQGLSGGQETHEDFTWRPDTAGGHVLHVSYIGTEAGRRYTLQAPARIMHDADARRR